MQPDYGRVACTARQDRHEIVGVYRVAFALILKIVMLIPLVTIEHRYTGFETIFVIVRVEVLDRLCIRSYLAATGRAPRDRG